MVAEWVGSVVGVSVDRAFHTSGLLGHRCGSSHKSIATALALLSKVGKELCNRTKRQTRWSRTGSGGLNAGLSVKSVGERIILFTVGESLSRLILAFLEAEENERKNGTNK